MMDATRYPLSWPANWKRTSPRSRRRAAFSKSLNAFDPATGAVRHRVGKRALTVSDAIGRLSRELMSLGATGEILSTNVATRLDGLPRSNQPEPSDPGAAVYFKLKKQDRCLACDTWDRTADNIAAIAQHIDALRRIERYGVGTMDQAFAGYAALPAGASEWWVILGVEPSATLEDVELAFKTLARQHHPDAGDSSDTMARLTAARVQARAAFR